MFGRVWLPLEYLISQFFTSTATEIGIIKSYLKITQLVLLVCVDKDKVFHHSLHLLW